MIHLVLSELLLGHALVKVAKVTRLRGLSLQLAGGLLFEDLIAAVLRAALIEEALEIADLALAVFFSAILRVALTLGSFHEELRF